MSGYAAGILLAAAAVCLICLLFARPRRARFVGTFFYSPSCGTDRSGRRRNDCRGFTTGTMPSIETVTGLGNGLCPGILGVPA